MQKLPARRTGTPDRHIVPALHLRFMHLSDERWQHMGVLQVKVVPRPINIGRHCANEIRSVLSRVRLAKFDPGDLGDRVWLVRRSQGPGEQRLLLDRLRCQFRVDTRATEEQ